MAIWRIPFAALLITVAAAAAADDQQRILGDISATARVDPVTAAQITNAIIAFMQDLQWRIGYIASSTDSVNQKDQMARETIGRCFVSESSEVQVFSATTHTTTTHKV